MRPDGRAHNALRAIRFTRHYTKHAEGSVLVEFGQTKVLCTASIENSVPNFLKGSGKGWITAEYGMLPRATHSRNQREASRGKQDGRTIEIQRLIGRSLRAVVDTSAMKDTTVYLDCDVLQADGGTRTAAITGGYVALHDALSTWLKQRNFTRHPVHSFAAAVSVGIYKGQPILDLCYQEDVEAETDMNLVMNEQGQFIEIQGTAEGVPFKEQELASMLQLGRHGIQQLIVYQRAALGM